MIQLGGNIELEGFDSAEPGKLVVIKKLVGSYARQMSDSGREVGKLSVSSEERDGGFHLRGTMVIDGKEITGEKSGSNLFYTLDSMLRELTEASKG
ncbi:MAG: hypothetical protein R6U32_00085 [Candidatus Woesearchaeota archaeon]